MTKHRLNNPRLQRRSKNDMGANTTLQPLKITPPKTVRIMREIFRSGPSVDGRYVDPKETKTAYENTKKFMLGRGATIPAKDGHDDKNQTLKGKIVDLDLRRAGDGQYSVWAKIDLYQDLFQKVKTGTLPNCSVEFGNGTDTKTGKSFGAYFSAVAFLGTDPPALSQLDRAIFVDKKNYQCSTFYYSISTKPAIELKKEVYKMEPQFDDTSQDGDPEQEQDRDKKVFALAQQAMVILQQLLQLQGDDVEAGEEGGDDGSGQQEAVEPPPRRFADESNEEYAARCYAAGHPAPVATPAKEMGMETPPEMKKFKALLQPLQNEIAALRKDKQANEAASLFEQLQKNGRVTYQQKPLFDEMYMAMGPNYVNRFYNVGGRAKPPASARKEAPKNMQVKSVESFSIHSLNAEQLDKLENYRTITAGLKGIVGGSASQELIAEHEKQVAEYGMELLSGRKR